MDRLKSKVENLLNKEFELAMCLYYPRNYFAPHHNDQTTSEFKTILPSISLGAEREFNFNDKISNEAYSLDLANGSLLIMGSYCQSRYTHSLLQNTKYKKGRIHITFREPSCKSVYTIYCLFYKIACLKKANLTIWGNIKINIICLHYTLAFFYCFQFI